MNALSVLKCPYYVFLKMIFHAVCNSSKWMNASSEVLNLKVHVYKVIVSQKKERVDSESLKQAVSF